MRLIAAAKALVKRWWPPLSLRTILFGTLLFVAALPGVGAVFLRVYENTLVQQTEAELIAQGAVLAAAYRAQWGGPPDPPRRIVPEPPTIDLRGDPVFPAAPGAVRREAPDARAAAIGRKLAPIVTDSGGVTLAATRLLDRRGVVVAGRADIGLSHAALPEVRRALAGETATVLRNRFRDPNRTPSPIEMLSRSLSIRVHHARPVIAGGEVVGVVMLSRSPRGLLFGIWQDRGKIALGVVLIFATLVALAGVLSRGIARPIRALTLASRDVARGGVVIPEPPATAAIEIRDLYLNFAVMAQRIEQRTRYLRDFAAAVSHEFKTPLTGIRGALELLDEHGPTMDEAERRRFLANATADADRLARLVQRLLDLARADMGGEGDDPVCDPVAVARGVAAQAGWPVTVEAGEVGAARVSAEALATVLTTLIDNARQAGASRVAVTITANGGAVALRVADDGPGVDPADADRVFAPFFTGNRASGGTGLGLPIARSLLAASGGTLDLEAAGPGAVFVIGLPGLPLLRHSREGGKP